MIDVNDLEKSQTNEIARLKAINSKIYHHNSTEYLHLKMCVMWCCNNPNLRIHHKDVAVSKAFARFLERGVLVFVDLELRARRWSALASCGWYLWRGRADCDQRGQRRSRQIWVESL